jgi:CHASE2 domain-containing sensor protein
MEIKSFRIILLINIFVLCLGGVFFHFIAKLEALNPIVRVFEDYSITDFYFSQIRPNESIEKNNKDIPVDTANSDIYIIDIGSVSKEKTRKDISELLYLLNTDVSAKAIGIDVNFKGATTHKTDSTLVSHINMYKPVLVCDVETIESDNNYYMVYDGSSLPSQYSFQNIPIGFTNFLVEKKTKYTDRYFTPHLDLVNENGSRDHFAIEMVKLIDQRIYKRFLEEVDVNNPLLINYRGSYLKSNQIIKILDVPERLEELNNKIILIGQCSYTNHPAEEGKFVPKTNEDAHFTPKNTNYIGKSFPDMNGIEIHAHIISSIISETEGGAMDIMWSSKKFNTFLTIILSVLIYFGQLYWAHKFSISYTLAKYLLQLGLVILFVFLTVWLLKSGIYLDLTTVALVSFFTPQVIEVSEGFTKKIHRLVIKFKSKRNESKV